MFASIKLASRGSASVVVLGQFKGQGLDKNTKTVDGSGVADAAAARAEATGDVGRIVEGFAAASAGGSGKGRRSTAGERERVIIVGLGEKQGFNEGRMHKVAAALGRHLATIKPGAVELALDGAIEIAKADAGACGRALGEGLGIVGWCADEYRGSATEVPDRPKLTLHAEAGDFRDGLNFGLQLAESTNLARRVSHAPPNVCTPDWLASEAKKLARQTGMKCQVYKGKQLLDNELVGLHTVGQASDHTPCLIRLEYTPTRARRGAKPAVLVGKTITYDSGGLSIKVGGGMRGMKRDMDGGAGVLGAMHAIATAIKPRRKVVALLCAAENAISDEAYRPDDVMTYPNGVTVEVTNTDAEGRLVLADGLCWACAREKPGLVVDMATLTGGVVVALGSTFAGMWCDDDQLRGKVEAAACKAGERVWRMPLHEEYRELMRSPIADIHNSAPVRAAHPIQGAAFLSYFVEEGVPWCHLDIAGVHSVDSDTGPFAANTATGFGVRTLAHLVDMA
jgi:leucyl aminopeptidase